MTCSLSLKNMRQLIFETTLDLHTLANEASKLLSNKLIFTEAGPASDSCRLPA